MKKSNTVYTVITNNTLKHKEIKKFYNNDSVGAIEYFKALCEQGHYPTAYIITKKGLFKKTRQANWGEIYHKNRKEKWEY